MKPEHSVRTWALAATLMIRRWRMSQRDQATLDRLIAWLFQGWDCPW